MRPPTLFLLTTAAATIPLGLTATITNTTQDLLSLQSACQSATNVLEGSLNDTSVLNTSDLIQSIVYQIGASLVNAGCIGSAVPPAVADADQAGLDDVYLNYTDELSNLAAATIDRGRTMHGELNAPVSAALASLANAVYVYGNCLAGANAISTQPRIRTWRAGSNIVEAESAWNDALNYPGRRRRSSSSSSSNSNSNSYVGPRRRWVRAPGEREL